MSRSLWLILCWAAAWAHAAAQTAFDPTDPAQQLAAELVILNGDVHRLRHEKLGPQETLGLEKRLLGGMASLPLALRRADADASLVKAWREAVGRRDWRMLVDQLERLKQRYPFDARPFLAAVPSTSMRALGAKIHREVCAACHDNPSTLDTLLPAKNLSAQLRSMPRDEFAARLWLGVRGDKTTAYANPFSTEELAALTAWYAAQP